MYPTKSLKTPSILNQLPFQVMVLIALVLLLATLPACSRKDEGSSVTSSATTAAASRGALDAELIEALPESSFGFLLIDASSSEYKKYLAHASAASLTGDSSDNTIAQIAQSHPELQDAVTLFTAVREGFTNSGLLALDPQKTSKIAKVLTYVEFPPGSPVPAVTGVAEGLGGENLEQALSALSSALTAKGYPLKPHTFSASKGYSFEIPVSEGQSKIPVYVCAKGSRLGFGSSEARVAAFVNGESANTTGSARERLKQDPRLQKLLTSGGTANSFAIGFLDITKVLQTAKTVVAAASGASTAAELDNLPFEAALLTAASEEQRYSLLGNPKTEAQKAAFNLLSNSASASQLSSLPADSLMGLHLDGALLRSLRDGAISSEPSLKQMLPPQAKLIDGIQSISLSLRGPTGPLPVPDIGLSVRGSETTQLKDTLRSLISAALSEQLGANASSIWQKKTIGSTQAELAMAPMGIGAYLGGTADTLLLTSSERMFGDIGPGSKVKTLADSLPAGAGASGGRSFVDLYFNFQLLADTLQQLQSSLALFTGGQSVVDQHTLDSFRALGVIRVGASLNDNVLGITMLNRPGATRTS